jgi:membrane protein YdbS with pleckstrin-like domain
MREGNEKLRRVREAILLRNSSQHREHRQAGAYRSGRWLEWGAIATGMWAIFNPSPYWITLSVVAIIPWIALVLYWIYPDQYEIAEDPKLRRVELFVPILFSGLALALRAMLDIELTSWTWVLLIAAGGGALLALAAGALRSTAFSTVLTFTVFAVYLVGLLPLANAGFDYASPRMQRATVDALKVSSGRRTTYYAQLSPGIGESSTEVTVDQALYQRLKRFDQVCVLVHRGALGIEWFEVRRCNGAARG